jgi:hypothetical protein
MTSIISRDYRILSKGRVMVQLVPRVGMAPIGL